MSHGRVMNEEEIGKDTEEAPVTHFKGTSQHLPGRTKGNCKTISHNNLCLQ